MPAQRDLNNFSKGMVQDVDILNQPKGSYRYSLNGDLIYNPDGTFSWENERGTTLSFTVAPRAGADAAKYIPLGYARTNAFIILLSVRQDFGASEIGIIGIDSVGNGSYKTLFNDQDDPSGEFLNFANEIEAKIIYESDQCIRVYWVDGVKDNSNPPRSFTFSYDRTIGASNNVAAYSPVTTSVFEMDQKADSYIGIIKYVQRIGGNLRSGVYQYAYRLVTSDGYKTPWYGLTRTIMLPTDIPNPTNWHEYEFDGSDEDTINGNQIEVKGIDTRYKSIEVVYIHSTTDVGALGAAVFVDTKISGTSMVFNHVSMKGEPIEPEEVVQVLTTISAAQTVNHKRDTLYLGNIREEAVNVDINTVLSGLTITPIFREMRDDELAYNGNAVGGLITNQGLKTGTTTKRFHQTHTEDYQIVSDYVNYKGTQIENLYEGYFRDETYRLGIVFFSKKGTPSFVYHLADIKMPSMYDTAYSWQRIDEDGNITSFSGNVGQIPVLTTNGSDLGVTAVFWNPIIDTDLGVYDNNPLFNGDIPGTDLEDAIVPDLQGVLNFLRVMGLEIGGINLVSEQSNLAGFQIVRVKRDATILCQGLIMPCVRHASTVDEFGQDTKDLAGNVTNHFRVRPFVSDQQRWDVSPIVNGTVLQDLFADNRSIPNAEKYELFGYTSHFEVPDILFDVARKPTLITGDGIKIVGSAFAKTGYPDNVVLIQEIGFIGVNTRNHLVQKLYYTNNDRHNASNNPNTAGYPEYGQITDELVKDYLSDFGFDGNLENWTSDGVSVFDIWNEGFVSRPRGSGFFQSQPNPSPPPDFEEGDHQLWSWGHDRTWYILHGNWGGAPPNGAGWPTSIFTHTGATTGPVVNTASFLIANYVRPNPNPYGGLTLSSLETEIFFSTGHFQPINNPSFSNPAGYVYNEIEVWGGDCYLGFFTYLRLYPRYDGDKDSPGPGTSEDYAIGFSFPLESVLNHAMRSAPSPGDPVYGNVGSRPDSAYSGSTTDYENGLFYLDVDNGLLEEFNINAVLLNQESNQFFFPRPQNFKNITDFPTRWRYSNPKIYGDPEDAFRIFQANNFNDLDGRYGPIISSGFLFNTIYSWQEQAFGRLRAYDRALIESSNTGTLTTGIGGKLDGVDYISTEYGNQHQFSLSESDKAFYWVDVAKRKIMRFAQDGVVALSDVRGLHFYSNIKLNDYENVTSPSFGNGIRSGFDYKNQSVYFTWKTTDEGGTVRDFDTIQYNEIGDFFVSFHSWAPTFYITHKSWLITHDERQFPSNEYWTQKTGDFGSYYGSVFNSVLRTVSNQYPMYAKSFDNIRLVSTPGFDQSVDEIELQTDQQTVLIPSIQTDPRKKYLEGVFRMPTRAQDQPNRMRGQHIQIEFRIDNTQNLFSRLSKLVTLFRVSSRI